jgi:hypothetical protein
MHSIETARRSRLIGAVGLALALLSVIGVGVVLS